MYRFTNSARILVAGLCACTGLSVAGCGQLSSSSGETTSKPPVVAILSAVSASAPVPDGEREQALATVVDGATKIHARVVIDGITAKGAGTPLANEVLAGAGANPLMQRLNLAGRRTVVRRALREIGAQPRLAQLNVIQAIDGLAQQLQTASHGQTDVALVGSIVPANPLARGALNLSNPAAAVNTLVRARLVLPCAGWVVAAVAPDYAPNGSPLSATADSDLEQFYKLFFERCGGRLATWTSQLLAYPVRGSVLVHESGLYGLRHHGATTYVTLHDVAFALNSATLTRRAEVALGGLVGLLKKSFGKVLVTGFTDSTGSPQFNDRLSGARAASVAGWLERHAGLTASRVVSRGRGSANAVATNRTAIGRSKNRRVVIAFKDAAGRPA